VPLACPTNLTSLNDTEANGVKFIYSKNEADSQQEHPLAVQCGLVVAG